MITAAFGVLCIFLGLRKIAHEEYESWGKLDHAQRQLVWGGMMVGFGPAIILYSMLP